MDKQQIVAAIKRHALDNGGRAPGLQVFERTTGVKKADWYPHIWLRWGDALVEAGYTPNTFQTRTSDQVLIENYIRLARELEGCRLRARFGGRQEPTRLSQTTQRLTGSAENRSF